MTEDSISLRATIFRDECPELFAQLTRMLPEQKFRRRFVLIEILRKGCKAHEEGGPDFYAMPAATPPASVPIPEPRVNRQAATPERVVPVAPELPLTGLKPQEVELEMDDLEHLFGGN